MSGANTVLDPFLSEATVSGLTPLQEFSGQWGGRAAVLAAPLDSDSALTSASAIVVSRAGESVEALAQLLKTRQSIPTVGACVSRGGGGLRQELFGHACQGHTLDVKSDKIGRSRWSRSRGGCSGIW